jgi:hypothetical protein
MNALAVFYAGAIDRPLKPPFSWRSYSTGYSRAIPHCAVVQKFFKKSAW